MNRNLRKVFLMFCIFIVGISACSSNGGNSLAPETTKLSGLYLVIGNRASSFLGNGNGDGLLLDNFSKENKVNLKVQVADDRGITNFQEQMIAGKEYAPDAMIVDDSLQADKLQKVKYIASHKVGIAVRSDVANGLGLQGNTISFVDFVPLLKAGKIATVASNALAGADSAEFFFSTMAWCSQTDAANLTADIIQKDYVRVCGKEVYSFIKSVNGSNAAIDLVYNTAVNEDPNGYNAIVTFDSALLGKNGLNNRLISQGKHYFKFYYFKEATAQASVTIGSKDLNANKPTSDTVDLLTKFLLNENSQKFINQAGFTEGSSALVRHDDTAFKAEWGVASNPVGVQIVNPPISSVANRAKLIYRDIYKRIKIIYACVDVSPSMFQEVMDIDINGKSASVYRIQALDRATLKVTDPDWLKDNEIVPGPNDIFKYYFFSAATSGLVTSSIGADTKPVGDRIDSLIGPWDESNPENWSRSTTESKLLSELSFRPSGTEMFDCSNNMLEQIKADYSPEVDYYIVILTDGENNDQSIRSFDFYNNWLAFGRSNITLIGIAFGTDGVSIKPQFTRQFNGNTYVGNSDADLVNAFKVILGN